MSRCSGALLLPIMIFFLCLKGMVWGQADYKRYFDEDNLPKVREFYAQGRYDIVVQICDYARQRAQPASEWRILMVDSLAALGYYDDAYKEARATAEQYPKDLFVLIRLHRFFKTHGHKDDAALMRKGLNAAAREVPKQNRSALDLVRLGQAALILGADPSKVMEQYFGPAIAEKKASKEMDFAVREAHIAAAAVALEKEDLKRAAQEYQAVLGVIPDDIEVLFGMAQALLPTDREAAGALLQRILNGTEFHSGAHLLLAESAINFDRYDEAAKHLDAVEAVNGRDPKSHAYRAILSELVKNDPADFQREREVALAAWKDNPEIDYLIGRVLSRKYRYSEGAESQRRALAMDPDFAPAKLQLAQDLLRLGKLEEAWPLAHEVATADPYNILAYNLGVLEKEIAGFDSLKSKDFLLRMPPDELPIYGDRVITILEKARSTLEKKYGITIPAHTLVEFYPDQQDFAIRSFGSLGGAGLLGVCFGTVITMNSPGSITAAKSNWEATLWHEYCHVITLGATKNRMPRWLSEGISVYEEIQCNPTWGQTMTPEYRRMILEENALTPIRDMSQAFFRAKDSKQVMFAYYQSMLVVSHIITSYGQEALKAILSDLGRGVLINDSLSRRTVSLDKLEAEFELSVKQLAQSYGPDVDWTHPEPREMDPLKISSVQSYLKKHPNHLEARTALTALLIEQKNWDDALESAELQIALLPDFVGERNGYVVKSMILKEKGDSVSEIQALEALASRSSEALFAFRRLVDLHYAREEWDAVITNADRALAIDPFDGRIHFDRGCALESQGEAESARAAFETALKLDPKNPSEIRFRLARLLRESSPEHAKRYLLDALADSPRYRDAYTLLLQINEGSGEGAALETPHGNAKPQPSENSVLP